MFSHNSENVVRKPPCYPVDGNKRSLSRTSEFDPNQKKVTRVFFEGGHSRILEYDDTTTVAEVLDKLNERLEDEQIKTYYGLALMLGVESGCRQKDEIPRRKVLQTLDENDPIIKIAQLPYSHRLRLFYRMIYPPSDVHSLYERSRVAFEYLYEQFCNDLKHEGLTPEPDEDTLLRFSALHLLEYVHSNYSKAHGYSKDPKVYIRLVKKERGIEYFVPASMAESVLDKDGKRVVSQYKKLKVKLIKQLKKNFEEFNLEPVKLRGPDYIKLLFLDHLSQLSCYPRALERASTTPNSGSELSFVPRRNHTPPPRRIDYDTDSLQKLYDQRYLPASNKYLNDPLRGIFILPPPPPPYSLTQLLTDQDIEKLRVPPPPYQRINRNL